MQHPTRKPIPRTLIVLSACVGLCLLAALAGGALWISLTQGALAADVGEVLTPDSGARRDLACQMLERSRTGYCLFTADEGDIQGVARRLGLETSTASGDDPHATPLLALEGGRGCRATDILRSGEKLPAYWAAGRPKQLALRSGGQFEYLLLLYDRATRQACVQVSYAYG
jgi:uncharacterized membrane protein